MAQYRSYIRAIFWGIIQQVAVLAGVVVWMLLTIDIPGTLSNASGGTLAESLCLIAIAFLPFFFMGLFLHLHSPKNTRSGRWIWVLPFCFLLNPLVSTFRYGSLARVVKDFLAPPSNGEAWWAVAFGTYPFLGCLGYSLGVLVAANWAKWGQRRGMKPFFRKPGEARLQPEGPPHKKL